MALPHCCSTDQNSSTKRDSRSSLWGSEITLATCGK